MSSTIGAGASRCQRPAAVQSTAAQALCRALRKKSSHCLRRMRFSRRTFSPRLGWSRISERFAWQANEPCRAKQGNKHLHPASDRAAVLCCVVCEQDGAESKQDQGCAAWCLKRMMKMASARRLRKTCPARSACGSSRKNTRKSHICWACY